MYCRECGKEIDDNAKFCPKCGYEQISHVPSEANNSKKKNNGKKAILLALIGILVVVFVILLSKGHRRFNNELEEAETIAISPDKVIPFLGEEAEIFNDAILEITPYDTIVEPTPFLEKDNNFTDDSTVAPTSQDEERLAIKVKREVFEEIKMPRKDEIIFLEGNKNTPFGDVYIGIIIDIEEIDNEVIIITETLDFNEVSDTLGLDFDIVGFNKNQIVGSWDYVPSDLLDAYKNANNISQDEEMYKVILPFFFQFKTDNTVIYKEGNIVYGGAAGQPDWFGLTEGYGGSYEVKGNRINIDFKTRTEYLKGPTEKLDEIIRVEMEIVSLQEDELTLRWISGNPPYFSDEMSRPALSTLSETREKFEKDVTFTSSCGEHEFPLFFAKENSENEFSNHVTRPDTFYLEEKTFITKDSMGVRSGPGEEYDISIVYTGSNTIPPNTEVKAIGQMKDNDDWYFVEFLYEYTLFDGAGIYEFNFYGWVKSKDIEKLEKEEASPSNDEVVQDGQYWVTFGLEGGTGTRLGDDSGEFDFEENGCGPVYKIQFEDDRMILWGEIVYSDLNTNEEKRIEVNGKEFMFDANTYFDDYSGLQGIKEIHNGKTFTYVYGMCFEVQGGTVKTVAFAS